MKLITIEMRPQTDPMGAVEALKKIEQYIACGWKLINQKNFGSWRTPEIERRCKVYLTRKR